MSLGIKNLKKKNLLKIRLLLFLMIIFICPLFFYYYFQKIESNVRVFFLGELKEQVGLVNYRVNSFFQDGTSFLYYTKKYLEKEFDSISFNKKIEKEFKTKYTQTTRNLVSNYKYVLSKRKDRKKLSASYLNKNEIVNKDIKYITVITERLDNFWKFFLRKYPFVSMTYVDRTGFYREFPFRKIEPNAVSYLSDPRNYHYYAVATTIAKEEIFLTRPYQHGNELYVSLVVPVYQKDSFRGLLTIDITINNFMKLIHKENGSPGFSINNIILFDNKGNIYAYLIGDNKKRSPINLRNLKEILKNQEKLLTKNIKIYPLIADKAIINFIEDFLKNKSSGKKEIQIKLIEGYALSLNSIDQYDLNILTFVPLNYHSYLSFILDIEKGIGILLVFLLIIFGSLFFIIGQKNSEKEFTVALLTKVKNEKIKDLIFTDLNIETNKNILDTVAQKISAYIEELNKELNILKISIDNINMGLFIINEENDNLFTNRWFKQLILDVNDIELMPEELKNEIHKFKNNNAQNFKKMIKLFERHYFLTGEKISVDSNGSRENILIFTLTNAEDINRIKSETKELKNRIKVLEESLISYRKSFEDLNTRIIQSDKFAVFGELIQGIVHNINNPLMIVTSRLSMVKTIIEGLDESMEKRRLLKHMTNIIASLKKINEIIDSVLMKAKMTVEQEERLININDIIRRELEFFNADLFFKHKVNTRIILEKDLPNVRISQSDFSQVLHNLIKNALDALKSSPTPTLTVQTYFKDGFVVVEIMDNGPGVPDKYKDKIFEQYFTTKGSHGTGIGLYNARKIIEEYNGELILEDSKEGARFVIKLPPADGD